MALIKTSKAIPIPRESVPEDSYYNEDTGMEYEWYSEHGIITAAHIDVGLVNYYHAEESDWEDITDGL